ncbi:hydrolase [Geodermatophilus sp. TF02-6]|nr:hydrolase [Geodermatophilus sp. TF02-6]
MGATAGSASAAPGGPSDTRIASAQAAADAAAVQLEQTRTRLATAQATVSEVQARAAIALDGYQAEQAALQAARSTAQDAQVAAARAAVAEQAARDQLVAFARRSYEDGSTYPGAAALLSADGPAELLERVALLDAAGAERSDEVDRFTAAAREAATAADTARNSLQQADVLQQQAAAALAVAQTAERRARAEAADLAAQQADLQAQADAAHAQLVELLGEQQAAARAAQADAAAAAAAAAASSSARPSSSAGSSSDSTSHPSSSDSAGPSTVTRTTAGPASGSAVDTAIAAAEHYVGTPYSWGGGGARGPSSGIDPDAGVVGFDCSGLVQYAYAQAGFLLPRNARAQFAVLPKVAAADLQPGDLVFWASGSDYTSIYHVALYIGNGRVVQAPQSGDVVRISSMWFGSDYFGAVRPTA